MSSLDAQTLFATMSGDESNGFATIHAPVQHSASGTAYLQVPGVVVLSRPTINMAGLSGFLGGYDPALQFSAYLGDPTILPEGAQLCKVAGQICYMSLGPKRSKKRESQAVFRQSQVFRSWLRF